MLHRSRDRLRPLASVLLSILFLAAVLTAARARGRQEAPPGPPIEGMTAPSPPPQAPTMPPPLPGGQAPDLDLVFTSQVAGWIEPCG